MGSLRLKDRQGCFYHPTHSLKTSHTATCGHLLALSAVEQHRFGDSGVLNGKDKFSRQAQHRLDDNQWSELGKQDVLSYMSPLPNPIRNLDNASCSLLLKTSFSFPSGPPDFVNPDSLHGAPIAVSTRQLYTWLKATGLDPNIISHH